MNTVKIRDKEQELSKTPFLKENLPDLQKKFLFFVEKVVNKVRWCKLSILPRQKRGGTIRNNSRKIGKNEMVFEHGR